MTSLLLALLATPAAGAECVPYAQAAEARDGSWLVIVKTADNRACPIITGEAHNVTLGSLI